MDPHSYTVLKRGVDFIPDKAEELIEKLLFLEKVERGQQDVQEGKTGSFEAVSKHITISLN